MCKYIYKNLYKNLISRCFRAKNIFVSFFYYQYYNRTLGKSLSRIFNDVVSITPPGNDVYTRN